MGNNSIAATPVVVKVARTQLPMPTQNLGVRRLCTLPRTKQSTWPHSHLWRLSHHGVELDQKKVVQLPPLRTTWVVPDPADPASTTLEPYRLWSFVFKKAHDFWVWIALCRKTRQVVAYAVGDRSKKPCLRLWEAIPSAYRRGHCFTDFWATYAAVIPEEQHTAVGKETGETAHVERWNNTALPASGSFCPHDVIIFEICGDARSMFASLSPSLQE
jgi:insertion element IS1 protein InsB